MKTGNFPEKLSIRREKALIRLEAQLKSNVKDVETYLVPLTDSDIARIKREIETLNKRINPMARELRSKKHRR